MSKSVDEMSSPEKDSVVLIDVLREKGVEDPELVQELKDIRDGKKSFRIFDIVLNILLVIVILVGIGILCVLKVPLFLTIFYTYFVFAAGAKAGRWTGI